MTRMQWIVLALQLGPGAARPPVRLIRAIRAIRGEFYLGAREATIFSKHGSPRSGSHHGYNFNPP